MREEAHVYALTPLLHQAADNPSLTNVLRELLGVPKFRESYERTAARMHGVQLNLGT